MIDVAYIKVKGGKGGDGSVSFRREKYLAKGGPDGGDGGKGGDVYFLADNNLATLRDFKSKELFGATDGEAGSKKKMSGGNGADVYIKVPVGTLLYEIKNNREVIVCDLAEPGQLFLTAKGGKGGKGNHRFKSSTNQAPLQYTPGYPGEEKKMKLEIRLVADIGLIGMPNVGKSTLINKLTNSNAKVANYPFTTLDPNLGIYRLKSGEDIVIADIPGLIEGASEGKGLGDEFLRHVQRTRLLVHIIDITDGIGEKDLAKHALDKYKIIRGELESYGQGLAEKKEIVVINKVDLTEIKEAFLKIQAKFKTKKIPVFGMSAATGEGIVELMEEVEKMLRSIPKTSFSIAKPVKLYNMSNLPNRRVVFGMSRVREFN
jgi:GTPase